MLLSQKKREKIDCLPALVEMTVAGKRTGHMTSYAFNSSCPAEKTILETTGADGKVAVQLPETMACSPGVWTICLMDSCVLCDHLDVELVNDCRIESAEITPMDPDLEEGECPCP